jgi:hypothetical protein
MDEWLWPNLRTKRLFSVGNSYALALWNRYRVRLQPNLPDLRCLANQAPASSVSEGLLPPTATRIQLTIGLIILTGREDR